MRLAFSTLGCPEWSLGRVVDAALEYGYEGIELRILEGELVSPAIPDRERRRVRATLERASLPICCLDTSFEIANPGEDLDDALGSLELAADLGAPMIRLFGGAPADEPFEATARRVGGRLAVLAERGRAAGVVVALETHDSFAGGAATAAVLRDAPEDVGIVWDTLNSFVTGEPPEVSLAHVAERLVHVHVKDGGRSPDAETNALYGDGAVPLDRIVRLLSERGYDGWLSVEWEKRWQPAIAEPEVALPRYAERLRVALVRAGTGSSLASVKRTREGHEGKSP
jgi:sugar phosphate isomerase/epimerase